MNRRNFLQGVTALGLAPVIGTSWAQAAERSSPTLAPLETPHSAWRGRVSEAAYQVLFEEDTERPGSSPLNDEKRPGTYLCAACYLPLFRSEHKYDSGTGWPSFTQAIEGHVGFKRDFKLLFPRTEYHCARCGGHQGHRFNDGPPPRGERWCNNGVALRFVPLDEPLPALRS